MRFSAIFPILLSIAAFILAILVLFAGRQSDFLVDTYIIKVDTSNLGGNGTSLTGNPVIDTVISTQSLGGSIASRLGLHDIYKAFPMNYCEGAKENNSTEKITSCDTQRGMFAFDPVKVFENELLAGTTLSDLGINRPDVESAVNALRIAWKAMFVAYSIGIGAAGLCIIFGLVGFMESRLAAFGNWIFAVLSFIFLGIASVIATVVAVKLRDAVNREMGKIGIRAYYSPKYLGMTWGAVAAMLIVIIFWCGACCSRGRDRRSHHSHHVRDADESDLFESRPAMKGRPWRRWRH